jgi:hypothetical protein
LIAELVFAKRGQVKALSGCACIPPISNGIAYRKGGNKDNEIRLCDKQDKELIKQCG